MTAAGDYKTVQDHRRSCRGGVEKRHSRFARPLWPSQHSTPCEGEEGAGVLAPISPCCRQMKQLVDRRDSVACGSSLQLLIPAFCRPVVGKGPDPIWRPVAYVVSKRFNTPEPSFLKKPAQPATHIRLGDPHGPPDLLADVVKASWGRCLIPAENKAAVIHRCRTNHTAVLRDTPQFRHNIRRIVQCLKHGVAKDCIEGCIVKRQLSTVGEDAS